MSSYTPNIPQPSDDPSDSQDVILQNFQTLNNLYGTTGDHYPWTNQTAALGSRHAKVTLPIVPNSTGTPPGDVVPTPAADEGVIFTQSAISQSIPYYRKDLGTLNFPLLPVRAMGRFNFTTGAAVGTAFNLAVTAGAGSLIQTLSFTENMPDANYLVFVSCIQTGNNISGTPINGTLAVGSFNVTLTSQTVEYSVMVLHYA